MTDKQKERAKFILTSDELTRNVLKKRGFSEVSSSNGVYVFINDFEKLQSYSRNDLTFIFSNIMRF